MHCLKSLIIFFVIMKIPGNGEDAEDLNDRCDKKGDMPTHFLGDNAQRKHGEKNADVDRAVVNGKSCLAQMFFIAVEMS